jgi:hypothetical protein
VKMIAFDVLNFKRVRVAHIEPKGPVTRIRGKNGAGKSSCLDAIAALFGGQELCPAQPIRKGETEASIRSTVDDFPGFGPVTLERRFWLGKDGAVRSELKIFRPDGLKLDKPQKRLDELIGKLTFDPLAFLRLPAKEQAETLRGLIGLDFSLLDMKRRGAFEQRTVANREAKALKARFDACPVIEAPDALVSAADLLAEQQTRNEQHEANEGKRREFQAVRDDFKRRDGLIAETKKEIDDLEAQLVDARRLLESDQKTLAEIQAKGQALRIEIEALVDPDMEEIPAKLRVVEFTNDCVRAKQNRAALAYDLKDADAEVARLEAEIDAIDRQKEEALASAHLPVPGLRFDETGVTLDGLPLDQASQAQRIRASVAIGGALNPGLRATLIKDGSLMDEDSLALLTQEAEKADLQVILETVSTTGDGILIVDGEVEGAAPLAEASHA